MLKKLPILTCLIQMPAFAQTPNNQMVGMMDEAKSGEKIFYKAAIEVLTEEQIKYLDNLTSIFTKEQELNELFKIDFLAFAYEGGLNRVIFRGSKGTVMIMDTGTSEVCTLSVLSKNKLFRCFKTD